MINTLSRNCVTCRIIKNEKEGTNVARNTITNEKRVNGYIRNISPHRRDKEWDLTMEYALELMSKPCAYCGDYIGKMMMV